MKSEKKYGFYIGMTKEEKKILKILKEKHHINITGFLKTAIREKYKNLEAL